MNLLKRIYSHIPTQLPTGMTELRNWLNDICELVGPIADRDSIMFVAGHECIQLSNKKNRASKASVVRTVKKFAFNQCMGTVLTEINKRHEASKIMAKQTQQEATQPSKTSSESNVTPITAAKEPGQT